MTVQAVRVQAFLVADPRPPEALATMTVRKVVETYGREFPGDVITA